MAVFIEVESDPFRERMLEEREAARGSGMLETLTVRRPLRGVQVKENAYSYIRVVDKFGHAWPMFDTSAVGTDAIPISYSYSNYLLGQVQFSRAERYSIVQTFGDAYVFMFGEQPIQAAITGSLVSSADFTWPAEFWALYDMYLRGTRLAELGARMYLFVDGVLIEGVCLSFSDTRTADQPHLIPFNMNVLVTNIQETDNIPARGTRFPVRRQQIDMLASPDVMGQVERRSSADDLAARMGAAGVEALARNRAAYAKEHAREKNENRLRSWEQTVAGGQTTGMNPLRFNGFVSDDAIAALDRLRPRIFVGPPLRSLIQDNVDEYLARPVVPTGPSNAPDETVAEDQAAEDAGVHQDNPVDHELLYPQYHHWDDARRMWVYDPPPGGGTPPINDPFDVPDRLAPPTSGRSETLSETVGGAPDGSPSFGSGPLPPGNPLETGSWGTPT